MYNTPKECAVHLASFQRNATVRNGERTPRKRETGVLHQFEQDTSGRTLVLADDALFSLQGLDDPQQATRE
jgi:hypothetical protein